MKNKTKKTFAEAAELLRSVSPTFDDSEEVEKLANYFDLFTEKLEEKGEKSCHTLM